MEADETLQRFMNAWCDRDPVTMEELMQRSFQATATEALMLFLGAWYGQNTPFPAWTIESRVEHSPVFVEYRVKVFTALDAGAVRRVNLIREAAPFEPHVNGTWGVNPISVLEVLG